MTRLAGIFGVVSGYPPTAPEQADYAARIAGGRTARRSTKPVEVCDMALRQVLRQGAVAYLQPGEEVQAVFAARRRTMLYNDRAVVATERRLLLLALNFFGHPTGLLAETDRRVRLGPGRGLMHPLTVFDAGLVVSRRFFKDLAEADRSAGLV
jgi:hypothetical protein